MSLFRCVLLVSLFSLLAAAGLYLLSPAFKYEAASSLFAGSAPSDYREFRGAYALLSTDASVDDRALRSLLEEGENFFAGEVVSESSQWVLLDTFDSLEKIPLDKYHSRVFSFDPRNDGYADKLKEIFIKDGRRFVYIPLAEGYFNIGRLDKQFEEIFSRSPAELHIPFSVEYFSVDRPSNNNFFLPYAAASLCLLVICLAAGKQNRKALCIIFLIPVISVLAWNGASGTACAALFFGLFILIKEPLYEIVSDSSLKRKIQSLKGVYKEIIYPYRFYWLFLPLFAAGVFVIVNFSQLKYLFLLAVFSAAAAVYIFSMKILSASSKDRRRFTPVMIMRRRFPEFDFSLYMLPFVIAAFYIVFSNPLGPAAFNSNRQFDHIIDEGDYYSHLNNQAYFSMRQMGGRQSAAFPGFFFAADGLPSMEASYANQAVDVDDFPPFPLENLMRFFNNVNSGQGIEDVHNDAAAGGRLRFFGNYAVNAQRISLLVLLLFLLPAFFINKRKKSYSSKIDFGNIKRISSKLRSKGINWNSKPLYNEKNPLRIKKDA